MLRDKIYSFRVRVRGGERLNSAATLSKHIRDLITPPCPQITRAWNVLLEMQDKLFSSAPRLESVVDGIDDVSGHARDSIRAVTCALGRRAITPYSSAVIGRPLSRIHSALYRDYVNIDGLRDWDTDLRFVDAVLNSLACRGI